MQAFRCANGPSGDRLNLDRAPYLHASLSTSPNNWFRTEESKLVYTPSRVSFFEVFQNQSNDGLPKLDHGRLQPEEVEDWLKDSQNRASSSSSSLRMLFGECEQLSRILSQTSSQYLQIPFSRKKFESVLENMCVQPQYVWALEEPSGQVSRFRGLVPEEWSYIFKIGIHTTGFYTMSVSYDPTRRLTSVLLLAQTHFHDSGMIKAMLYWRNYKVLTSQPMLVPFLVSTCVSALYSSKIQLSIATLNAIEEEMGQHTYTNRYRGDPLEVDFVAATTGLNSNSTRLAINETRLKSMISALCKICGYAEGNSTMGSLMEDHKNSLLDHLHHLKDYCENLLLRNDAEQKRTASQLAVVYNFMAQKDNLLNIALAKDSKEIAASSKRDSSAMKTIAVVTMVFLPGTYIAALFAMPLFIWDAPPGNSVLNNRFWYYWIVTIPLTVFVLVFWFTFAPVYKLAKQVSTWLSRRGDSRMRPEENPSAFHISEKTEGNGTGLSPFLITRPTGLSAVLQN